jgi:hypothetical protein
MEIIQSCSISKLMVLVRQNPLKQMTYSVVDPTTKQAGFGIPIPKLAEKWTALFSKKTRQRKRTAA